LTVAETPLSINCKGNPNVVSEVPTGASCAPYTAAIIPGAAVVDPDQLLTRPEIDILAEVPTVSVTGTLTTWGCALKEAIVTTAVYAPGESPAGDAEMEIVPGPVPDAGEIVSHEVV
jgi:hypothetical protein